MKKKFILIFTLFAVLIIVSGQIINPLDISNYKQNESKNAVPTNYRLVNIKPINIEGEFTSPVWSPDGNKILFSEVGFIGIYIYYLKDNSIKKINNELGVGYKVSWSNDSRYINYQNKIINSDKTSLLEVKKIDINSQETQTVKNVEPNAIESYSKAIYKDDLIVYTNNKTLLIEAQTLDKTKKWIITNDPGQYYRPILSPDKTKVVVHNAGKMHVYNVDGSGKISTLGNGIATSWSNDGKQLLYFLDESQDGHQISGSEIYLCNSDGSKHWVITHTESVSEMYPYWSPDNTKITYSDDKSGKIFIADLIKQ